MARPQAFSEQEALQKAIEVFWQKGFHATSMQDLVKEMGVCRASLYKTYGNKEDLYEKALQSYRQEQAKQIAQLPENITSVKDFLRNLYRSKAREIILDKHEGCLIINATSELAARDERIRAILVENESRMRQWFEELLQLGIRLGEFPPEMDTASMAHFLLVNFQGLTLNAMTQDQPDALDPTIETTLQVLG